MPLDDAFWLEQELFTITTLLPHLTGAALLGVDAGADLAQHVSGLSFSYDLANQHAESWASQWVGQLVTGITDTTRKGVADDVAAYVRGDLGGFTELMTRLNTRFDADRAQMIAQTEVTRAYAQGNGAAWNQAGLHLVEWRTAVDERVCPLCGPLDNKVMPLDQGMASMPRHPRCRCWMVPVEDMLERLPWPEPSAPASLDVPQEVDTEARQSSQWIAAKTVTEAENLAREYGVKTVDYGKHLNIANMVNEVLTQYKDMGLRMPGQIIVDKKKFPGGHSKTKIAAYDPVFDMMILNPAHPYWKTPQEVTQKFFDDGWWVSPVYNKTIWHELGHVNHSQISMDNWHNSTGWYPYIKKDRVIAEVGRYAAVSPAEFVAEVFAGLRTGRTFGEDIMKWYRDYRGPEVKE